LGLPVYWKNPFFNFAGGDRMGHVTLQAVLDNYKRYVTQFTWWQWWQFIIISQSTYSDRPRTGSQNSSRITYSPAVSNVFCCGTL